VTPTPGDPVVHRQYDALLFDLDGVLYRGDEPVAGAAETIHRLRAEDATIRFLTNNSARTPDEVAERLRHMGIEADAREVVTSAGATAALLRREGATGSAYVIGERGIRTALADVGIEVLEGTPQRADLVVVGWDRDLTYDRLRTAALLIQRGARLVATNADATYPAADGLWPGGGAILAAVVTATGVTPTVVGKPSRPMFEAAAEETGAARPLVIGDRLDTDVAGAATMGWDSLLVLTGASRIEDLAGAPWLPTFLAGGLDALLAARPPARPRPAEPADARAVEALLARSDVSADDAAALIEAGDTVVLPGATAMLATGTVVPLGDGWGLLRSVAVDPEHRGLGLGPLAVSAAAARARAGAVRRLALFTQSAGPFFERLGFAVTAHERLPASVLDTSQARECASATAMTLEIGPTP
jgi:glycerol-1-phosphatase